MIPALDAEASRVRGVGARANAVGVPNVVGPIWMIDEGIPGVADAAKIIVAVNLGSGNRVSHIPFEQNREFAHGGIGTRICKVVGEG